MRLNEPKCVYLSFQRLVSEGYTKQEVKKMIAAILLEEMYFVLIDILSLPDDLPYCLFGDSILEAGSRMLASVCGTDTDVISREKQLEIEKTNHREKAKEKRLQAHNGIYLCHWDDMKIEDLINYNEDMPF